MADGGAALVTIHRFFVAREAIAGDEVRFTEEQSRQLERVLRLRAGDHIIALDNSGAEYEVVLDTLGKHASGRVIVRHENTAEPGVALDLYAGVLKGSKFETVLQKGTEVGVARFVPTLTARSVPAEPSSLKLQRYQAIAREAAEQSHRGRVPEVAEPLPLHEGLAAAIQDGPVILLWEDEKTRHLITVPLPGELERIALFVGPEGGFTAGEAEMAREIGGQTVTLGPRILRAETAGVVGPALLLARLAEFG